MRSHLAGVCVVLCVASARLQAPQSAQATANGFAAIVKADGLRIQREYVPPGCNHKRRSKAGDAMTMQYTGKLTNGNIFDSSRKPGREPFRFTLGAGQVIKGWDEGLVGLCVGERLTLTIPSALGYGDRGYPGSIPPKATLIFEVEVVEVCPAHIENCKT